MIFLELCISASECLILDSPTNHTVRAASINPSGHLCARKKRSDSWSLQSSSLPDTTKKTRRWRPWPSWFSAPWQSSVWPQVTSAALQCARTAYYGTIRSYLKYINIDNWFICIQIVLRGINSKTILSGFQKKFKNIILVWIFLLCWQTRLAPSLKVQVGSWFLICFWLLQQ